VTGPLRIEVSDLADRQIHEADLWWRQNRETAPNAIREELERIGALIAFQPHLGARATNVKLRGVRRFHIERIHYDLYYRTVGSPPESVEIVAFWGSRRGSGPPI
jgi:plasmid stabilization system protein ParE